MQDWTRIYWPLVLLVFLQLLFLVSPQIDVWVGDWFTRSEGGFLLTATGMLGSVEALLGTLLVLGLLVLPWLLSMITSMEPFRDRFIGATLGSV